jgi:hypothetical protein
MWAPRLQTHPRNSKDKPEGAGFSIEYNIEQLSLQQSLGLILSTSTLEAEITRGISGFSATHLISKQLKIFFVPKHTNSKSPSQVLLWRLTCPTSILPNGFLSSPFIGRKLLYLRAIHVLRHLIGLPFLETKAQPLMRVVFVICLILMVFHSHKIGVDCFWVQRKGNECVDRRGLRNDFECPGLEYTVQLDKGSVGGGVTNTCSFLNWITSSSLLTTWYPSFLLALNSFGSANHWPAIL